MIVTEYTKGQTVKTVRIEYGKFEEPSSKDITDLALIAAGEDTTSNFGMTVTRYSPEFVGDAWLAVVKIHTD